ncbi:MAG: 3'-5' exonuclease [Clostridiaceae bacterium]|jgi:DNA polymerase III epsilon subunit family exonuclease|nr:3'-5' exonuclease [Clostridiaceae bacterium]
MAEFIKKLNEKTGNRYAFLRLNSAYYISAERLLKVNFLFPSDESDLKKIAGTPLAKGAKQPAVSASKPGDVIDEAGKREVEAAIKELYPEIICEIKFTRSYADAEVVKNKVIEYLNDNHKAVLAELVGDDIAVETGSGFTKIKISAFTPVHKIFIAADTEKRLTRYIEKCFCLDCFVELSERSGFKSDTSAPGLDRGTVSVIGDSFVKPNGIGAVIFGSKAKRASGLNFFPLQIKTVSQPTERGATISVSGTVGSFQKNSFRNAEYNPEVPVKKKVGKFEIEVKEFTYVYKWTLDDTTDTIECVLYRDNPDLDIEKLKDGEIIAVTGVAYNRSRDGVLTFRPDAAWYADIDFSAVAPRRKIKSESKNYALIKPERYEDYSQSSLFDEVFVSETPAYLAGKTFVVFDFETTGVDASDAPVQLGACKMVDGKIVETFQTLINPGRKIPIETSRIHGIYDKDVVDAPSIKEVLPDFFKFTREAVLAAHNAPFDMGFLKRAAEPEGYVFDNMITDTCQLARQHVKGAPNNKLGTLCEFFKIELNCAHNAIYDAVATAKLLKEIAKLIV